MGLGLGAILTFIIYQTRPVSIPEKTHTDFSALASLEAKKYALAKTPDEKLRAAEELYGKMVILFLANLGLELQKSTPMIQDHLPVADASPSRIDETQVISAPAVMCPPCQSAAIKEEKKFEAPKLSVTEKFGTTPYFNKMEAELKKILGRFEGALVFFAGSRKGKTDHVLFLVDLQQEGRSKTLKGQVQVVLTDEDGKSYSRNVGRGGNKTIKYATQERMVYIEASPMSFFAINVSEFNKNEVRADYYDDNKLVGRAIVFRQ